MPQVINNFVNKVLRLVREFFLAEFFEYGALELGPINNGSDIIVHTLGDVLRVWFTVDQKGHDGDYVPPPSGDCYIGEAHPCPGGFYFRVKLSQHCRINWFAIEENP